MENEARQFLVNLANAYNQRDPVAYCSCFALDDPRFCLFEEFSGDLLYAWAYAQILTSVEEATGTMSFELLDSSRYGEFSLIHAIQRISHSHRRRRSDDAVIRATLFLSHQGGKYRILSGHFSSMMLCFPKQETVIRWRKMAEGGA